MRFNFSVWNHNEVSRIFLKDMIEPIGKAMIALGYERPIMSDNWSGFPLFFECFSPSHIDLMDKVDRPFGLICTEWFDGRRLSGHVDERAATFIDAAKRAKFLWTVAKDDVQWDLGIPTAYVHLGWEENYYTRVEGEPLYDLCIYGGMNYSREKIRIELDKLGLNYVWLSSGTQKDQRDAFIHYSKFVLDLPSTGVMGAQSITRVSAAMHNDRPLLSVADIPRIRDLLPKWDEERQRQLEEFKAGPSLRDSLSAAMSVTGFKDFSLNE